MIFFLGVLLGVLLGCVMLWLALQRSGPDLW